MEQTTLTVLKNMATINKSIRIDAGSTLSIYNDAIPLYMRAKVPDNFPKTFSLYNLNQWLSTLSLFGDYTIEYEDQQVVIDGGRMQAKYRYSAPSTTADQPTQELPKTDSIFSFTMSAVQLQEIIKATSVLGLSTLEISPNGIRAYNMNAKGDPIDNEYKSAVESLEIKDDSVTIKPVRIKVEALKFLPLDYNVHVTNRSVVFESTDDSLYYLTGLIVI